MSVPLYRHDVICSERADDHGPAVTNHVNDLISKGYDVTIMATRPLTVAEAAHGARHYTTVIGVYSGSSTSKVTIQTLA